MGGETKPTELAKVGTITHNQRCVLGVELSQQRVDDAVCIGADWTLSSFGEVTLKTLRAVRSLFSAGCPRA